MSKPHEPAREFQPMAHPGRNYAVYETREGYNEPGKVRLAYIRTHKQEPEEVIWHKPGFWLAGPVPLPAWLIGVDERPEPEPEIETTAIAGEQRPLF